jgi:mycofactocin precursor peptide peptidase
MQLALAATTWPRVKAGTLVLVPVGSTEQHGPHLPFSTDTEIAVAVAEATAKRLRVRRHAVLVAPAVSYGSSGEHQDFAGTSSIGTPVLREVLVELTRSMMTWASRIVFINGHGGNIEALRSAIGQLLVEGHDVEWIPCATEDVDLHAGRTETSLMLHIAPWSVRLQHIAVGNTQPLVKLLPTLIKSGVRAVSANGVLGDPRGATAAEGKLVLEAMTSDVTDRILLREVAHAR